MKKLIPLISLCLLFAACKTNPPAENQPEVPEITPEIVISIDYMTEEITGTEYVDFSGGEHVIVQTNAPAKDFSFIKVDHADTDLYPGEVLYTERELSPGEQLVFETLIPENFPTRGISYIDHNNIKKTFAICWNGSDGSLYLMELE